MPVSLAEIATNLELRPDGLWVTPSGSHISYPDSGNQNCFKIEESSFWFQHRNNCILEMLRRFPSAGTFFDIGGGNGYVAQAIERMGIDVVLIEPGFDGARNALSRGVGQVVWGTMENAGLLPGTLDAVGLFDVIEHIEDDLAFLISLNRLQPGGGRAYITVPAFQALWSHEDKIAGHWRRYTLCALTDVLRKSGYRVEFAAYIFEFLIWPVYMLRVLPYRLGLGHDVETAEAVRADHEVGGSLGKKLIEALMRREVNKLASGRGPHFGTTCVVVARK